MPRGAPVGGLAHAFPGAAGCLTAGRARNALAELTLPQQLRQLGDVGRITVSGKWEPQARMRLHAWGLRQHRWSGDY